MHPDPRPTLVGLYQRIIHSLQSLPAESVYRQSAESINLYRLGVMEKNSDIATIEKIIGAGQIEELMEQAQAELRLIPKMEQFKVNKFMSCSYLFL